MSQSSRVMCHSRDLSALLQFKLIMKFIEDAGRKLM